MKAEDVLNKVANEHSYDDWAEAMYDTHPHTQIEFAVQAMEEYSSLQIKELIEEIEKELRLNSSPLMNKEYVIDILKAKIK
jgi:hypothetical protein